jgi:hypothetical protein
MPGAETSIKKMTLSGKMPIAQQGKKKTISSSEMPGAQMSKQKIPMASLGKKSRRLKVQ